MNSPYDPIKTLDDAREVERHSGKLPIDYNFVEPDAELLAALEA